VCDPDDDGDGVPDASDACPEVPNACELLDIDGDDAVFGAELSALGLAWGLRSIDPAWWWPVNYAKEGIGLEEIIDGEDLVILSAGWGCDGPGQDICGDGGTAP